ncbi:MAG: hypothetical protein ACSHYC_00150 [Alphaproteobacteria bacterium]
MTGKTETKLEVDTLQRRANSLAQCASFSAYATIVVATFAYFYLDGSGVIERWARTSTEEPCVHGMTLDEAIQFYHMMTLTMLLVISWKTFALLTAAFRWLVFDAAIPSKIDQLITATRTAVRVSKSAFQALVNHNRSE